MSGYEYEYLKSAMGTWISASTLVLYLSTNWSTCDLVFETELNTVCISLAFRSDVLG